MRRLLTAINNPADHLETAVGVAGSPYPFDLLGFAMSLAIEGEAGKINPVAIAVPVLEQYVAEVPMSGSDRTQLLALLTKARETRDAGAAMEALHAYLLPALTSEGIARDFSALTTASIRNSRANACSVRCPTSAIRSRPRSFANDLANQKRLQSGRHTSPRAGHSSRWWRPAWSRPNAFATFGPKKVGTCLVPAAGLEPATP